MFETDDYDDELLQFECPELETTMSPLDRLSTYEPINESGNDVKNLFHKSPFLVTTGTRNERKFPGPAGILVGCMSSHTDNNKQSHVELSQDEANSQNQLPNDVFDTRMWKTLKLNVGTWFHKNGGPSKVETIKSIKLQASEGTLVRQKAPMVIGFIQCIDRSIADPLMTLRDSTGEIKCTLDREAWCAFSVYLRPEQTALAVWKPTVLTFGVAHKRHYLNITLSNVHALYCTMPTVNTKQHQMPHGYERNDGDEFTIIERVVELNEHYKDVPIENLNDDRAHKSNISLNSEDVNLLDGLDADTFCEDF